jgi:hypothetical protein
VRLRSEVSVDRLMLAEDVLIRRLEAIRRVDMMIGFGSWTQEARVVVLMTMRQIGRRVGRGATRSTSTQSRKMAHQCATTLSVFHSRFPAPDSVSSSRQPRHPRPVFARSSSRPPWPAGTSEATGESRHCCPTDGRGVGVVWSYEQSGRGCAASAPKWGGGRGR